MVHGSLFSPLFVVLTSISVLKNLLKYYNILSLIGHRYACGPAEGLNVDGALPASPKLLLHLDSVVGIVTKSIFAAFILCSWQRWQKCIRIMVCRKWLSLAIILHCPLCRLPIFAITWVFY